MHGDVDICEPYDFIPFWIITMEKPKDCTYIKAVIKLLTCNWFVMVETIFGILIH